MLEQKENEILEANHWKKNISKLFEFDENNESVYMNRSITDNRVPITVRQMNDVQLEKLDKLGKLLAESVI